MTPPAIPFVRQPKHVLDRVPGGGTALPLDKDRPWLQLAKLRDLAPRLDGAEACCGHCAHLTTPSGESLSAPAPSPRLEGFMHLSPRYGCALEAGPVLCVNVCQRFERREGTHG